METLKYKHFQAVVIGASAGGLKAFMQILPNLPTDFPLPILIAQHLHQKTDSLLVELLAQKIIMSIKEAEAHENILSGMIYVSPPGYHMLVEPDYTIALSVDDLVNYSRPSIDVLFESAADVYKDGLIGILLTGANDDGAHGLKRIADYNGLVIVQDPSTAEASMMPSAGIRTTHTKNIFSLAMIADLLETLKS